MRRFFLKLWRRRRLHQDLQAELAFHRDMTEAGGNPIPLGNGVVIGEEALDLWRFTWVENLWRDIAYATRGLGKSPALVLSALLSLALGIGANATIFSLALELLFSQPSASDPASLVGVRAGGNSNSSERVMSFIRASGLFQDIAGVNEDFVNWNDGSDTRPIFGVYTTNNYFTAIGASLALGRGYSPNDPKEVVVLQNEFWRRRFNADPGMLGRAIELDGRAYTVVGVLAPGHRTLTGFGLAPALYLPRIQDEMWMNMYARLKPGMPLSEAQAGLQTVTARLDVEYPAEFKYADGSRVLPLMGFARIRQQKEILAIGLFFAMLLVVVGLVLLIACVNVASLLLARASARRREIAIRLALGASRARMLQQLLVESLLLAILGAGCGLALAQAATILLARIPLPLPVPIHLEIEPNWRVAVYAAFLTILATLACGLLPAWQAVRESFTSDIHRDRKLRLRRVLVAAQIAVSTILLASGVLFLRNMFQANALSPGFDVRDTVRADVQLPPGSYKDSKKKLLYVEEAMRELAALPGIEAAAAARIIPFTDSSHYRVDLALPDSGERVQAYFHWNAVTPDYFRTMDIPIRQGRTFAQNERGGAEPVVIVNQTFAERYLGKRPAAGRVILWGAKGRTPYTIVGVVEGTRNMTIGEEPSPQLYEPLAQIANNRTRIQFVLRSKTPPAMQLDAVRNTLRRLEPAAGLDVSTLYSSIGLAFLPSQVGAALLGSIGTLGLTLAAIGLYGVMVFSVARRTREIGVRMAVGARRADISRMILGDSFRLVGIGSAIGLAAALLVTQPLAQFLMPGLKPSDPISFSVVVLTLGFTALVATWGAVRRAMAIDPISALRYE